MSDQTPGCGSTSDARKRHAEQSCSPEGSTHMHVERCYEAGRRDEHEDIEGATRRLVLPSADAPASLDPHAIFVLPDRGAESLTVDGQANDCTHSSATGIDTTSLRDPAKVWRCDHCGFRWRSDGAAVYEPGFIRIPRPQIFTGPTHVSVDAATVSYLREAADRVRHGRYWGSGVTALVSELIDSAARAIERSEPDA